MGRDSRVPCISSTRLQAACQDVCLGLQAHCSFRSIHSLFQVTVLGCRYFTPAILELAGFRDKRTALLVAMLPAGVNAVGTLAGMWSIDRMGRRWGPLREW